MLAEALLLAMLPRVAPRFRRRLSHTMLVIRLQRTGRNSTPTYRVVVAEKAAAVKGKSLEVIGHYLPGRDPVVLEFKADRVHHWLKSGAHISNTVARLLSKQGVKDLEGFMERYTHRRSKKELPEEAAPPPAAAAAPVAETKEEKAEAPAPEAKEGDDKPAEAA